MTKYYVFWGGFALVMLGVVATLVRNYRRALAREKAYAARLAELATVAPGAASGTASGTAPAAAATTAQAPAPAFDPNATRIYARPEPLSQPVAVVERTAADVSVKGVPRLVCLGGRQKGRDFAIPAIGLTIGRAKDNDVVIIDGRVSSHHAWIGLVDGKAMLRDYQSLNGTFLNAQMDVPVSEATLLDGDTLFFGGHGGEQYRFVVE